MDIHPTWGRVRGGGVMYLFGGRWWMHVWICCIDKQQSSSDNWMLTIGEAGDGLGRLIGGGGGASLSKNTK